jgi:hypothetical protein
LKRREKSQPAKRWRDLGSGDNDDDDGISSLYMAVCMDMLVVNARTVGQTLLIFNIEG